MIKYFASLNNEDATCQNSKSRIRSWWLPLSIKEGVDRGRGYGDRGCGIGGRGCGIGGRGGGKRE